jgi:hydroxyacylglutathione hydrolase
MASFERLPLLQDNYAYLLWDGNQACVIDPAEPKPVMAALEARSLDLRWILCTHHHGDHTAGNADLKAQYRCEIFGGSSRIPGLDHLVRDQERLDLEFGEITVLTTPGHTRDSVCYYCPQAPKAVFTGDTLFAGGCGRLFEGTAETLWASFQKIRALPGETLVYPGHEYALDNYAFAAARFPQDQAVLRQQQTLAAFHQAGKLPPPSTLDLEKLANVFFRADDAKTLGLLREQKNRY